MSGILHDVKTDFLSRISHEIRTPMNAIVGMTKIALQSRDESKIRDCLEKIDASSKQMLAIINDILDVSEIESHRFKLVSAPFDVRKTLSVIRDEIEASAREKNQTLSFQLDDSLETIYIGDGARLSQVVVNLLTNAVKFTPPGGEISFSARQKERAGNKAVLELRIRDTGIGISPQYMKKIFSPFEQAEGGIARRFGGTGLGLVICKSVAELMEGAIDVRSEEGKGSEFTVVVKLMITDTSPEKSRPAAAPPELESAEPASGDNTDPPDTHRFDMEKLLPIIDVKRGLSNLKGNAKLYATLLGSHRKNDLTAKIRGAFFSGDLAEALRNTRALSSVAANLAMDGLREKADILEESLRNNVADEVLLDMLETVAREVLQAIPELICAIEEGKLP